MKKINYRRFATMVTFAMLSVKSNAQVTGIAINDNNASANTSAMLDINVNTASAKKGILIPRVTTTQRDAISSPATSLLVYNTTNTRFEYYTGSSWQPIAGSSSGWGLTGNSGTSESSNFIGTTDGQGLVFKINNTQAGYLGLSGSSYATSFGIGSSVTFKGTAFGAGAQTSANEALALGYNANASAQQAVAVGSTTTASSNESIAAGYNATASGFRSVAIGSTAQATTSNHTIAIGYNAQASSFQAIAIGSGSASTTSNQTIALGVSASASGLQAVAIGNSSSATAQNSMALGNGASVSTANYISIGNTSIQAIRGQVNFTTYSDGRFKRNIHSNVHGLDFITKLKPVTYTWDVHALNNYTQSNNDFHAQIASYNEAEEKAIEEKEKIRYTGFIAQQVEDAAEKSGYDFSGVLKPKTANDIYSLSYAEFVVPLVKATQELNDKNEQLTQQLTAQQEVIKQLMQRIEKLEKINKR